MRMNTGQDQESLVAGGFGLQMGILAGLVDKHTAPVHRTIIVDNALLTVLNYQFNARTRVLCAPVRVTGNRGDSYAPLTASSSGACLGFASV